MRDDRQQVLDLLAQGRISAEEAARLLDALTESAAPERTPEKPTPADAARMQGKKLHVEVKGDTPDTKKMNVNVSIPLVLARYADNIIANCVPEEATKELRAQGIDLRSLHLGDIVDTFETMEEDIVNADLNHEDMDLKVRVYVE